jgi:hypothetical protein
MPEKCRIAGLSKNVCFAGAAIGSPVPLPATLQAFDA